MKSICGDNYDKDIFNIPAESNNMFNSNRIRLEESNSAKYGYDNLSILEHDFPICEISGLNQRIFNDSTHEQKKKLLEYQIKYATYKLKKLIEQNNSYMSQHGLLKPNRAVKVNELLKIINELAKNNQESKILTTDLLTDFLNLTTNLKKYKELILESELDSEINFNETIKNLKYRIDEEHYPYFLCMIIHLWDYLIFKIEEIFNNDDTRSISRP